MFLKRLFIALPLLGLGLAGTATGATKTYFLAPDSGGQLQIGDGAPLPIQATCNATCTGTNFPPLLIPRAPGAPQVSATTTRTMGQKLVMKKK